MWNDHAKNLRGAEVWTAAKFANPQAGEMEEALTDNDGKQANTITKKEYILGRELFLPNEHHQYVELPQLGQVHRFVAEHMVIGAHFVQPVWNAPAPGKLSCGAVHQHWEWEK